MPRLVEPALPDDVLSSRPPVVVRGDSVILRPWTPADAPAVVTAFSSPDIQRWHLLRLDDEDEARTWIADLTALWAAGRRATWAVTTPDDDAPLGCVALRDVVPSEATAQLSYWVLPAARGAGLARRAAATATRWAFDELGLHRVWLVHSVLNVPSCAVAAGAGFRMEGTLRAYLRHADGWHDAHLHGRLDRD